MNSICTVLVCVCVCVCLVAQWCPTLWPHGLEPARFLCLWISPGKNTGVDCHSLLQGIKPRTPALQADSLPSDLPGKPTVLKQSLNPIKNESFSFGFTFPSWINIIAMVYSLLAIHSSPNSVSTAHFFFFSSLVEAWILSIQTPLSLSEILEKGCWKVITFALCISFLGVWQMV